MLLVFIAAFRPPSTTAATVTVTIQDFAYHPSSVEIQVGDTVTWVNQDSTQHTTTSGASPTPDGAWDSGLLNQGQSFSRAFTAAGSNPYFCQPHPFMTGTVNVTGTAPAPNVAISAPAHNATFPANTPITLEATASSATGTIASVEFFDAAASLGTVTNQPYRLDVTLNAGQHTLTAKATDNAGATALSAPVMIIVTAAGAPIDNPFPARIAKSDLTIDLETVLTGLISPLGLAAPDDGSGRLFVYDQAGLIYVVNGTNKLEPPLLDVQNRLVALGTYDERGLLGVAAHPNFAENPFIYTYTSEPNGPMADFMSALPGGATNNHQSVVAEWRIDPADTNRVDLSSRREIMRVDQPQSNHNGGTLRFGPDGYLYISFGDGGAADDQGNGHVPGGNAQNTENIYGALVRIDVDRRTSANGQYAAPADNPFASGPGLDETYAYGFRNPYNYSFDRLTGELYLADVGQNKVEELDRVFKGGNYGWPIKEASFYFDPNGTNAGFITTLPVRDVPADLVDPIAQYDHDEGLAIVGGYVYRGTQIPAAIGRYFAADWGSFSTPTGRLFYLDQSEFKEVRIGQQDRPLGLWVKGFGQDAAGELYIFGSTNLGPSGTSGVMLKIVPAAIAPELTAIFQSQTNLTVSWTNGVGPFALQAQEEIYEDEWSTIAFGGQTSLQVPAPDATSFYRLVDVSGMPARPWTVFLAGANERPNAVSSSGAGIGALSLEGNTLRFDIQYTGLSGPAVAAHIHGPARITDPGPVLIDLAPYNGGAFGTNGVLSGAITLTPDQKAMLLGGLTYVNVHTPAHPGGEIRGQVAPVAFTADLSGEAERPQPIETDGEGSGTFFLNGDKLSFIVGYGNLSTTAVNAHIHGPARTDEPAGILIDLKPFSNGDLAAQGVFAGTVTLTPEQLSYLVDGRTYVNVHTTAHTGGEIRGQILPAPLSVPFTALLNSSSERPTTNDSPATAAAYVLLEGNRARINASYSGLSGAAAAAHIHGPATSSEAANVLVDLLPFSQGALGISGLFSGNTILTDSQRALLQQGLTYLNIHTANHPGGEIRGQLSPVLFRSVLLGASERPSAIQTAALGSGHFLLIGDRLGIHVTYGGLSGTAGAAHIHGPAGTAQAANVLVSLEPFNSLGFGTSGAFAGVATLAPEQVRALVDELTYVNVHTPAHQSGEIRGQITR